jgi:hypothetical protein
MKPLEKLLRIDEVVFDEGLYPRMQANWFTINKYAKAMKAGATFPPIAVARYNNKYILIDGKHRLEAYKTNKETHLQAEIYEDLDEKQIYIMSVRTNATHGQPLSTADVATVIVRLQSMKVSQGEISQLTGIQAKDLQQFIGKRITHTISGKEVILKKSLQHLSGDGLVADNIGEVQREYTGIGQTQLLDTIISLLENKIIDSENPQVVQKLVRVYELIDEIIT